MAQEWLDYLVSLAQWYADEVSRAVSAGSGGVHTDSGGGPTTPPTPPGKK